MSQCRDDSSFLQIQGGKELSGRGGGWIEVIFPIRKSAFCIPRDHEVELKFGQNWETVSSTPIHIHQSSCHWYCRPYLREAWAQRPPLSFYHPFSSFLRVSDSSLIFLTSFERRSHLAGHFFWGEKVQLGEHNSVEIEVWEASASLTIPKWIFPHEECRWMMEQWRRQLCRIMSHMRGHAQGEGGSNASTWKSSHLCQQGAGILEHPKERPLWWDLQGILCCNETSVEQG